MRLLASDPWIAAQIDGIVAPYSGRLTAREIAWIREQLAVTLASDERAAALAKAAAPRQVEESGEVGDGESGAEDSALVRSKAGYNPSHKPSRASRG
jgi:hypothetical protein